MAFLEALFGGRQMGDGTSWVGDTAQTANLAEANTRLLHDSNPVFPNLALEARLERIAEVTGKGLGQTPTAALDSGKEMLKPENWGKDALMIGSSAVFGAVLRVALPETGALKTIAGVAMGGMFLKDAAMPVLHAWGKVWNDGSSKTMSAAAKNMGTGLGDFAVQGTVSMLAAGFAAKATPGVMKTAAPETWSKIESWKANNLAGASTVPIGDNRLASNLSADRGGQIDRINLSARVPGTHDGTLTAAEAVPTGAGKPSIKDLSPEQIKAILLKTQSTERVAWAGIKLSKFGIQGSDGNFHSHDDIVGLLLDGKDPAVEPAGVKTAKTVPLTRADLTQPTSIVFGEQTGAAHGLTEDAADVAARRGSGGHGEKGKTPTGDSPAKPPSDASAQPTDLTRPPVEAAKVTDASRILNAKNLATPRLKQLKPVWNKFRIRTD